MKTKELQVAAYNTAKEKGFWDKPNIPQKLMLIVSELGEALEADRKDRYFYKKFTASDPNEKYSAIYNNEIPFEGMFEQFVKNTFEDELADVAIRILDLSGYTETNLDYSSFMDTVFGIDIAENLLTITTYITRASGYNFSFDYHLRSAWWALLKLSDKMGIDLEKHIELKMRYNATRERLHGKKY